VAFDAFALLDALPVFQACETVAPGRGNELASLWRSRQFEYQWLRALGQRYEDFYTATAAALEFAGSKWFGYPTFWNKRQSAPPETLGVMADAAGATLSELLRWLCVSREL
jgi:hypothetical protein